MPGISLAAADAAELASFLRFLGEWLATDHGQLSDSLAQFMDGHPYGVETLRHDLARFTSLPGGNDGEHLFPPEF